MPFSSKTIDFLFENRLHDSKDWYHEHIEDYKKYVVEPYADFITELIPTMGKIDAAIVCNPKRISRLYRDARFAKSLSVFRDNVWCTFSRQKELYWGPPSFYFDISPRGFEYGCGYYQVSPDSLQSIRELILKHDKDFENILKLYEKQDRFILYGDKYKKNRFPNEDEQHCNWLNRKSLGVSLQSGDFDTLFSDNFSKKVAEDFVLIKPIYDFFLKAESKVIK